ncbi:MAG: A/G-specific adenine glycosylase [Alphaproteobacteria bacterium]|nr:A/G-specific adenine glycosylase [Alphaproteobacteria bacterium]MBU1562714.1 A/G-specific adenine glycosylase [Alphaproteobacteria bacterium]MBU2303470.1 A/G-specific adenine glycosylase [Alphaproteobacteria bacterium]MBU2366995.1 A/G-specific adenine glycosylase [Alphaproteobacteria bacterium]
MYLPDPAPIDAPAVLAWYDRHARELPWRIAPADRARGIGPDPYRIWLSEVMLQQTTVAAVKNYFLRFTSLWPTVHDLAAAPLDSVLKEWAGLGYYARARNLHACAQAVVNEHAGVFPQTSAGLQTLPGIGAYTSAAIAAICFDEPIAVLDGNLDRVLARYYALPVPVREAKEELRAALQAAVPERAGDFAQAMMDLGATICAPRMAACMLCPIQPGCTATKAGDPTIYPVKPVKAERPVRKGHAYVMRDADGDVYLQSRPEKGLLGGMTEVPGSAWAADLPVADYPVTGAWQHRGQVVHVFTHFRLELEIWSAQVPADGLDGGWWAPPRALKGEALPTLFRKVLAAAGLD